jgi:hypothetical protein
MKRTALIAALLLLAGCGPEYRRLPPEVAEPITFTRNQCREHTLETVNRTRIRITCWKEAER